MLTPQFVLRLHHELVIDLFAGGGGASTGIEQAIGRPVDVAINHDPQAVALHQANHPQTLHYVSDVFEVDPLAVTDGRPVGLLWASPDCTYHSKARGGKPFRDRGQANKRRALAGVVVRWATLARPRIICLENVEEFQHWGPLASNGQPCPDRRGSSFRRWVASLRNLGYVVEWRELRACDYGAPTIRKRLFLIARCDGEPIVWPAPTHGAPGSLPVRQRRLLPWRTAAECIDWDVPCPSIFERARPLADATCRRIAKGIVRYVIESAEPFIVPVTHVGGERVHPGSEPLRTITTASRGELMLASPTLIEVGYGERPGQQPRAPGLNKPLGTVVGARKHALVAAFLAKHYTGVVGSDLRDPMGTVTSVDHHSLVAANLVHMGHGEGKDGSARFSHGVRDIEAPLNTITASGVTAGLVQSFLVKYYGNEVDGLPLTDPLHTIPTRDRFGLVLVKGQPYAIADIGLRMLTPRELYTAQGFPTSYIIDRGADGRALTKTAQVRLCGNSVCPPIARALVAANFAEAASERKVA